MSFELEFPKEERKLETQSKSQIKTMDSSQATSSLSYNMKEHFKNKSQECSDPDKESSNQNNEEVFNSSNSHSNTGKENNEMGMMTQQNQPDPSNSHQTFENPIGTSFLPVTSLFFAPMSQNSFGQGFQPNFNLNNLMNGNNNLINKNMLMHNKMGMTPMMSYNTMNQQNGFNNVPVLNLLPYCSNLQQHPQPCLGFLPNLQMMNQVNPLILNKGNIVKNGNNLYLLMPLNLNKSGNNNVQKEFGNI